MPLVFSQARTFEARSHGATLNPHRIIMWIFLLNALLEFTENNLERIYANDKIDLQDIIGIYLNKGEAGVEIHQTLFNYLESMSDRYSHVYTNNHCFIGFEDEKSFDKTYKMSGEFFTKLNNLIKAI